MTTMQERYRFFHEHAGYVVGRAAEGALDLARAEAWAEEMEDAGRLSIRWEYDEEPYDQDIYTQEEAARKFDTGAWTGPYGCVLRLDGNVVASLWGIAFGPEGLNDPYARVVAAELADEARSDFEREAAERERAARQGIATVGYWLALREKWQAILDGASPGSDVDKQAREQLRYIDMNLRRLDRPLTMPHTAPSGLAQAWTTWTAEGAAARDLTFRNGMLYSLV